jgi:hypothetical protein
MARMVSIGLNAGAATATGAGLGSGAGAGAAIPGGRAAEGAAAPVRAAACGAACAGAAEGGGAAGAPPVGPPGGSVGNLIVGAAEGFGGKLILTVSFFGWTLPVSFLGGTAPLGILGMFSAINQMLLEAKWARRGCQTLIPIREPMNSRKCSVPRRFNSDSGQPQMMKKTPDGS